ncbi:MAG: DivIVA domain-containing protein [Actinobacteria bacterium]|nr:DivIVA domain-containing protein [Actinomycetota bacterium]
MTQQDRQPRLIRSTPRLTRDEIVNQSFPQAFRGLAEPGVRAFLRRVADEFEALRSRHDELFGEIEQLEARLNETRAVEEQDLMGALGEETARVLRSAKESAEEIRRVADEKATELVHAAHEEARVLEEQAEQGAAERTRQADEAAAELLREAERLAREIQEGAEARVAEFEAQAQVDAKTELESTRRRSRELLAEAQATRDRTLHELTRRREALEVQIEGLRAGRDRLLEAYRVVKRTLEDATEALRVSDARPAGETRRPRVVSPALPPQHDVVIEAPEPEAALEEAGAEALVEPSPEAPEEASDRARPATPPRVAAFSLGELPGHTPAPPAREPEPEPEPEPPAGSPAEAPVSADHRSHDAGEIFARLRAQEDEAPAVGEGAEASAEGPGLEPGEESAEAPQEEPAEPVVAERTLAPAPDASLRSKRDSALEPLVEELVRAVKRVVRDEQNVVLQAVREHRGAPSADDVLPSVSDQDGAFAEATADILNEACAAGEALARELSASGGANGDGAKRRARAAELASALARELMDPLRGKLGDALREAASMDKGAIGERVRARYREWKGQRIDNACRDALAVAFVRGLYDAVPDGMPLRWITTDSSPCPDCADNALEQAPRGMKFPTGHVLPPAHAGCHCVVLPAEAPAPAEVV